MDMEKIKLFAVLSLLEHTNLSNYEIIEAAQLSKNRQKFIDFLESLGGTCKSEIEAVITSISRQIGSTDISRKVAKYPLVIKTTPFVCIKKHAGFKVGFVGNFESNPNCELWKEIPKNLIGEGDLFLCVEGNADFEINGVYVIKQTAYCSYSIIFRYDGFHFYLPKPERKRYFKKIKFKNE